MSKSQETPEIYRFLKASSCGCLSSEWLLRDRIHSGKTAYRLDRVFWASVFMLR